jgi:hypothetical protein
MYLKQLTLVRVTSILSTAASAVALAAGLTLTAVPAKADVLASSWNVNPQLTGGGVIILDLDSLVAGQQNLQFTLPAPDRVAISFDAECAVGGLGWLQQANINIEVDPAPPGPAGGGFAPVQPTTGVDDAFCSSNNTPPIDGKVNPSRTVVTHLPAGINTVRVTLQTVGGPGLSSIDDLAVDVEN